MSKAVPQMIKFAFEVMKLRRIQARVIACNKGSIKVHEKCGIEMEAIIKDKAYKLGAFHDELLYAITSDIEPNK